MNFKSYLKTTQFKISRLRNRLCAGIYERIFYARGKRLYCRWQQAPNLIPEMKILNIVLRPDHIVFDIGANIGEFSYFLSSVVYDGLIFAFEPNRQPFQMLRGVCDKIKNAHLHQVGFSSIAGNATLYIPIVNGHVSPPEASLDEHFNDFTGVDRLPKSDAYITETIQLTTLDDFCKSQNLSKLDFVKIDVEGHELEVLKGGAEFCLGILRPSNEE